MGGQGYGRGATTVDIRPERITLRVCADLDWRIIVDCPGCRHGYMVWPHRLAAGKFGSVPIHQLLERKTFKCTTRCDHVPASAIQVMVMHVGMSMPLAKWKLNPSGDGARATLEE